MGFRPFSWGNFGSIPAPPEDECSGVFDAESCYWCSDYDKCKSLEEDFADEYNGDRKED